jgi:cardiolipin synthase
MRVHDALSDVQFFRTGGELFPALIRAIDESTEEICIANYNFNLDATGQAFIAALSRAARRGIRVRVLSDAFGNRRGNGEVCARLRAGGVDARVFRPVWPSLFQWPFAAMCRLHARVYLFDRKLCGLGGVGLGDIYINREDIFVLGALRDDQHITLFFDSLWRLARAADGDSLASLAASLRGDSYDLLPSGPEEGGRLIYERTLNYCRYARRHIFIATPFFFPDSRLLRELFAACRRGVLVEVVTPLRTDKLRYDDFRATAMPDLILGGATWYGTKEYFHAKFCIVDDAWIFGSANFDIISMYRNYELDMAGRDEKIHAWLMDFFRHLKNGAEPVTPDQVPALMKLLHKSFYKTAEFFFKLT